MTVRLTSAMPSVARTVPGTEPSPSPHPLSEWGTGVARFSYVLTEFGIWISIWNLTSRCWWLILKNKIKTLSWLAPGHISVGPLSFLFSGCSHHSSLSVEWSIHINKIPRLLYGLRSTVAQQNFIFVPVLLRSKFRPPRSWREPGSGGSREGQTRPCSRSCLGSGAGKREERPYLLHFLSLSWSPS